MKREGGWTGGNGRKAGTKGCLLEIPTPSAEEKEEEEEAVCTLYRSA